MNDFDLGIDVSSLARTTEQLKNLQAQFPDLSNVQFPTIAPVPIPSYITNPPIEAMEINVPPFAEHIEHTEAYQKKSIEILEQIQQNTAALYTITELINTANDKQSDMIALITEILTISKAHDKEEADTLFKKVFDKIQYVSDSAEAIAKLSTIAVAVYQLVMKLF
ncbi:hypothetical protein [Gemmiger sp.]